MCQEVGISYSNDVEEEFPRRGFLLEIFKFILVVQRWESSKSWFRKKEQQIICGDSIVVRWAEKSLVNLEITKFIATLAMTSSNNEGKST